MATRTDQSTTASAVAGLLALLDEAYDRRAWHGTNLRGAVRGLEPAEVVFRPSKGRHSAWELVVHAAYWKYIVRKRVAGAARGSFPLRGSNFFPRPDRFDAERWAEDAALLEDEHRQLRAVVAALGDADLARRVSGKPLAWTVRGGAAHDLYHAGQFQLLKMLARTRRR
jgi:hypothetical protein